MGLGTYIQNTISKVDLLFNGSLILYIMNVFIIYILSLVTSVVPRENPLTGSDFPVPKILIKTPFFLPFFLLISSYPVTMMSVTVKLEQVHNFPYLITCITYVSWFTSPGPASDAVSNPRGQSWAGCTRASTAGRGDVCCGLSEERSGPAAVARCRLTKPWRGVDEVLPERLKTCARRPATSAVPEEA